MSKPFVVLGIANTGHDASAAVFVDGKLISAIAEERLCRVKCFGGDVPRLAIDRVLKEAGYTRQDVDMVGLNCGYFPETYLRQPKLKQRFFQWRRKVRGKAPLVVDTANILRAALSIGKRYEDYFDAAGFLHHEGFRPQTEVVFSQHHRVHALLAGYYSGFKNCLVVTADGYGDLDESHTTSTYGPEGLKQLAITEKLGASPGLFYQTITELLGFRPLRHEGKVLGLAAFGNPDKLLPAFRKALRASPDKTHFDSDFADDNEARIKYLGEVIKGHTREEVAAAAQQALEESFLDVLRSQLAVTGLRNVALNGGVSANVKLNQRIAALPEVDSVFVFPGMSDTGNAVGTALFAIEKRQPGFLASTGHALHDVYLGPEAQDTDIIVAAEKAGLKYEKLSEAELIERAAQAIQNGEVVGWFQGHMEFGPRALGNRSMVARPTDAQINKDLNDRLDRTEFMPFAPSVLAEEAEAIFDNVPKAAHTAEFMTITFDVKKEWQPRIPAVVHVDGTARPQLVRADRNPRYHALIKRYHELSGIPLVLNTSFNVHEEPIVCAASEGIRALAEKRVDALAIGLFWVQH